MAKKKAAKKAAKKATPKKSKSPRRPAKAPKAQPDVQTDVQAPPDAGESQPGSQAGDPALAETPDSELELDSARVDEAVRAIDRTPIPPPEKYLAAGYSPEHARRLASIATRDTWPETFLKHLAEWGVIVVACRLTPIHKETVRERRKKSPEFEKAVKEALKEAAANLEAEARRRGEKGYLEPVYGKLPGVNSGTGRVGVMRKFSDRLLIELLHANNPKKFKQRKEVTHRKDTTAGQGERPYAALVKRLGLNANN